jgi:hypothetical protein
MTDFYVDTAAPFNSYLFYRQPDVISFLDLFTAVTGIEITGGAKKFLDYFIPKIGPILLMFAFDGVLPKIKLSAVLQWGSTAAMADFLFAPGQLRLEMSFVMQESCLGIQFCGCIGLNVKMSTYPEAKKIATDTYNEVVGKIRDEFPNWNPPFSNSQMGPSISLKAGRTNEIKGQVQAYLVIMDFELPFLPKIDVVFEMSLSRIYFKATFTFSFFGASCGTELTFDTSFSPFSLYFSIKVFWDFGQALYDALPTFVQLCLDEVGVSFSTPGGVLIGGGTSGFEIGFEVFGWEFTLSVSFGRIRRKLQEGNQTFLAKVKSFDSSMTAHTLLTQLNALNSSKTGMKPVKPGDDWEFFETLEALFAYNPCYHTVLLRHVPRFAQLAQAFKAQANVQVRL